MAPGEASEQPKPLAAADVAKEYLLRDLHLQEQPQDVAPLATVILHDACYGHRYSRPRTTKATLSTVVERPERILAALQGISAAYVLIGGRHAGSTNAPHPGRRPGQAPFRIQKTARSLSLVSPAVTQVHGTKWMSELKMMCEGAESKLALNGKELVRPTVSTRDSSSEKRLHEGDLYLCAESLNALEGALGGVVEAVDSVFTPSSPQRAFACVRPPGHHCSADYPSGFCWINNVHVGIAHAAAVHGLTHAAIIDFDLHHGDGSQAITWEHNSKLATLPKNTPSAKKYSIGYFSLHDINSYPCEWGDEEKVQNASLCIEGAHGQTVWNVHLQPWKTDADFWELYETRYIVLLDKMRAFLRAQSEKQRSTPQGRPPKAAIFISAGLDASEWEGEGMQRHKVNVPTDFYARFTQDIVKLSLEAGLAVDGRIVSVLEGGYSDRALMTGILSHICGLTVHQSAPYSGQATDGLAHDLSVRMGRLGVNDQTNGLTAQTGPSSFDTSWWSPSRLEELEKLTNPPPTPAPRKPRGPVNPTYTTPTQASVGRAISPTAVRRSISNPMVNGYSPKSLKMQASPPPDVSWEVATHELSKILTPADRQTRSYKPEELNAEATRVRKARQSAIGVAQEAPSEGDARMQLRDRRAKAPSVVGRAPVDVRPASRTDANRRRTVSGAADILDAGVNAENGDGPAAKIKPVPRRRVSAASTLMSTTEEQMLDQTMPNSDPVDPPGPSLPSKPRVTKKPVPKPSTIPTAPPSRPSSSKGKPEPAKQPPPKPAKAAASTESDLDALTSGVKKMSIKLKVPSKEEHDRREAEKKTAAKATKRPLAPKPVKPANGALPIRSNQKQSTAKIENSVIQAPVSDTPVTSPPVQDEILPPDSTAPQFPQTHQTLHEPIGTDFPRAADQLTAPRATTQSSSHPLGRSSTDAPSNPGKISSLYTPGDKIIFGPSRPVNDENQAPDEDKQSILGEAPKAEGAAGSTPRNEDDVGNELARPQ